MSRIKGVNFIWMVNDDCGGGTDCVRNVIIRLRLKKI
jgi:hypothetical protein